MSIKIRMSVSVVPGLAAILAAVSPVAAQAPFHVYLTWRGSPTTSMTVNAQTVASVAQVEVRWDEERRGGAAEAYANARQGSAHQIEGLEDGRWVHWIDLAELEPDTRYWFVVGSDEDGWSQERSFMTLPDDPDTPVRFAAGGDLGLGEEVRRLHAHAAARGPRFAVIGGDIAYVDGNLSDVEDWDVWFGEWEAGMVTPDGLTVPMVLAPGNHEVRGGYLGGVERAPFYTGFFAQPGQPSFFRQAFGPNLVFYVLDTGHLVSHQSQVEWLDRTMAADADVPHRFAAYHIPLYPSHREYDGNSSALGRKHWLPLFDRHGLTAAFENHDHTLKRSRLLRGGEAVDEGGTLYIGDGAWGRGDRTVDLSPRWYLEKAGANRHVWIVDVTRDQVDYRALDLRGQTVDAFPAELPDAPVAEAYFRTLPQLWAVREGFLSVDVPEELDRDGPGDTPIPVTVHNTEDFPATGTLHGSAEAPLRFASEPVELALEPGERWTGTVRLEGDPGDGFALAQVRAELEFDRGALGLAEVELVEALALEPTFVAERDDVPVLDGRVGEWSVWAMALTRPAPAEEGRPGWTGPRDASARVAVRHDGERLYLAVDVTDEAVRPGPVGDGEYQGDGLLVWVNGDDGEFDDDPYLAVPLPAEDGPAEVVVTDGDWEAIARATEAWAVRTGAGWSAELAIPFSVLEGEVEAGGAVRLNFALVDSDAAGVSGDVVYWRPEWESAWDAEGFGVVVLRR